jgi:hypothetical protein
LTVYHDPAVKPVDEYFQLLRRVLWPGPQTWRTSVRLPGEAQRTKQLLDTRSLAAVRKGWT